MNYTRRLFLPLLLALIAGQIIYFYPRLPPLMASHFGGQGMPDGFMSRDGFFVFQLAILALMLSVFFILPKLLNKLPVSLINLPHRDYWLAPERAAESLCDFEIRFNLFGLAVIAFITAVMQLVYQANLTPIPRLPTVPFVALLTGFFVTMIVWMIGIFRRHGKPPV